MNVLEGRYEICTNPEQLVHSALSCLYCNVLISKVNPSLDNSYGIPLVSFPPPKKIPICIGWSSRTLWYLVMGWFNAVEDKEPFCSFTNLLL